jgi:peptide/nickel transport system substrate-binding protein
MSPSGHRTPRGVGALMAALVLVITACGSPPDVSRSPSRSTVSEAPSSAPASTGPFRAMTVPATGEAPCDEADPPDASHAAYTGEFKRIRAKDARTVVFELCGPDVAFAAKLATPSLAINDTAWLQSKIEPGGGDPQILTEVNGTGPYRLDQWSHGSDITLVRNAAYWGHPGIPGAVVFRWRDDAGARLSDLRASTVDAIDQVAPTDAQDVTADPDLRTLVRPGWNVAYIGFNNRFAPFDSVGVRQAIAMGIDRDKIIATLYPPGTELASRFTPCSIPHGCSGQAWYESDPVAARDVLSLAGFKSGFKTVIHYPTESRDYLPNPLGVAVELQAQLKANLGIVADLDPLPFDGLVAAADAGKLGGIYLLGARATYPDASDFLITHFGPDASAQFGNRWNDIAGALDKAAATTDDAKRDKLFTAANDAIRRRVPMIPLAHVGTLTAYRADVRDPQVSGAGTERFAAVTPGDRGQFAWMGASEPRSLYCADETDPAALRVCAQVSEGLLAYDAISGAIVPALAQACVPVADLTIWTCTLRPGVTFHDGAALDANDVVLSFAVQWDAEHPLHRGRTGAFEPFLDRFGGFLHPPAAPSG